MASTRPGIPRTYKELFQNFGAFIASEIRKLNTVEANFEDAYQDVCTKIYAAGVLEKFLDRAAAPFPEKMTALECCERLGLTWAQWNGALWRYHIGRPVTPVKGNKTFRNQGPRKKGHWMPTPIEGKTYSRTAIFAGKDVQRILDDQDGVAEKAAAEKALAAKKSDEEWWASQTPEDRAAMEKEAERNYAWWTKQGKILLSYREPTTYHFLNYLGRAVRNHFFNFGRTRKRKWRDRTGDAIVGGKKLLGDRTPQFRTEDGAYNDHWEDTIRDEVADRRFEAQATLSRILDEFEKRGVHLKEALERTLSKEGSAEPVDKKAFKEMPAGDAIAEAIAEGYTLTEAIERSSIVQAQKRVLLRVVSALS